MFVEQPLATPITHKRVNHIIINLPEKGVPLAFSHLPAPLSAVPLLTDKFISTDGQESLFKSAPTNSDVPTPLTAVPLLTDEYLMVMVYICTIYCLRPWAARLLSLLFGKERALDAMQGLTDQRIICCKDLHWSGPVTKGCYWSV